MLYYPSINLLSFPFSQNVICFQSMAGPHLGEETPPSLLLPSSSVPLQLSGFLHGDTIQVDGDTGSLQFSVQFNIHNKHVSENHINSPSDNSQENNNTLEDTSFSCYMTPNCTHLEVKEPYQVDSFSIDNNETVETAESNIKKRVIILTRLRSGAISPVKYFLPNSAMPCEKLRSKKRSAKCGRTKKDYLKSVLRRHSLPIRPCSSYTFFVMANWSSVKNSSFGEASKTLGQMWCQTSGEEKKVFIDMASKDSARYKRQCRLLKGKTGRE